MKICIRSYEKKLDEIYTGEIHAFARVYKAEYNTALLGLLPDHVVFYKIDIIEI